MTRNEFIINNQYLFWYIGKDKLFSISDSVLIEFVLNFGDLQAVKDLFDLLGTKNTARIFEQKAFQERSNYFPEVSNFFNLYFQKNVHGYPFSSPKKTTA